LLGPVPGRSAPLLLWQTSVIILVEDHFRLPDTEKNASWSTATYLVSVPADRRTVDVAGWMQLCFNRENTHLWIDEFRPRAALAHFSLNPVSSCFRHRRPRPVCDLGGGQWILELWMYEYVLHTVLIDQKTKPNKKEVTMPGPTAAMKPLFAHSSSHQSCCSLSRFQIRAPARVTYLPIACDAAIYRQKGNR
jgi:hypothetical protein